MADERNKRKGSDAMEGANERGSENEGRESNESIYLDTKVSLKET